MTPRARANRATAQIGIGAGIVLLMVPFVSMINGAPLLDTLLLLARLYNLAALVIAITALLRIGGPPDPPAPPKITLR